MVKKTASDDATQADEVKFIRWMPGGSGAFLSESVSGQKWVIKLIHNKQGCRLLPNELLGAVLLRSVGLPSLPWRRFRIAESNLYGPSFGEQEAWFRGNQEEAHFASLYIGEPDYTTLSLGLCPEKEHLLDALIGLFVFDLWAAHCDKREVILARHRIAGRTHMFAIDNGHLFYGPQDGVPAYERTRAELTPAMRAAIVRPESVDSVMKWVAKLQAVLPLAIERQLDRSRSWSANELSLHPDHFRDRLKRLPSLARAEWERQGELDRSAAT